MKRAAPWIVLAVLTLACAGAGAGANGVLASFLAVPDGEAVAAVAMGTPAPGSPDTVASATPASSTGRSKRDYIETILGQNLFDHTNTGATTEAESSASSLAPLDFKLIGTFVSEPARYSAALIARSAEGSPAISYGVEDKLDDATILEIGFETVKVQRSDDSYETLSLTEVAAAPTPAPSRPSTSGDEDGEIREVGDNEYEVERALLDRYMTDLDAISRMGRAIPHRSSDGEIDGYRISGIRRRSMGDKLGIKNGDIVHSVNGQPLTSMQGAMAAYQSMQSDSSFSFEVTRRGQRVTMQYRVR